MNREQRIRRIAAIKKIASPEEFDLDSIPEVPYSGQFGNEVILRTDFDLQFDTVNLDELFMQSANKEWITIPDEAKRLNVPHLYYLDPNKATSHEKYFGVKTEFGFLNTPASAALFIAAVRGSVPRKNPSEMKALEVPPELRSKVGSNQLFTLDLAGESLVVAQSVNFLLKSKNRPDFMRRFNVDRTGEVEMTSSHSRGIMREPGSKPVSDDVEKRLSLLRRGIEKGIESYPRLERTIGTFMETLSSRMDSLMKEQQSVNRTVRFEGTKEETADILRQNILRLLLDVLNSEISPLQESKIYEQDHRII